MSLHGVFMKFHRSTFKFAAPAIFVLGLFCAGLSAEVCAQQGDANAVHADAAQKLDEFGQIGHCDLTARLDNFAVALQNDPQLRGYLVTYSGRKHVGAVAERWLNYMRNYLVNARGVEPERFNLINAGVREGEEVKNELWLAPPGALSPVPMPISEEEASKPFYGKLHEYETQDMYYGAGDGEGIPSFNLPNFAGRLKKQPDARGYLVVYEAPDSNPGAWRRIAKREAQTLQGDGLDAKRYSVIYAGEGKELKVELWVVAPDAPAPVAEAKERKTRREAFNLGSFGAYELRDADGAKWGRDGLADMLRDDQRARGYLIIHPATAGEEPQGEAVEVETQAEVEGEEPSIELPQLAERWRNELVKEFGIKHDRIVIVTGAPDSLSGEGRLETWVVPQDAAPPDPFALEDEKEIGEPKAGEREVVKIEASKDALAHAQTVSGKELEPLPTMIREFRRFLF